MDERGRERISASVGRALQDGPFSMKRLAADCDVGYDLMRAWKSGRRRPTPTAARRLMEGLERRAARITELAADLRGELERGGRERC